MAKYLEKKKKKNTEKLKKPDLLSTQREREIGRDRGHGVDDYGAPARERVAAVGRGQRESGWVEK